MISERKVDAKRIWVIALLPTRAERRELKARLNADELIHIDTGIDDCISNMLADRKRKDKEKEMKIIDDYFGHYQPPYKIKAVHQLGTDGGNSFFTHRSRVGGCGN